MTKSDIKRKKISEVTWRYVRVFAYLVGSWAISLGLAYITDDPNLIGLAPVLNLLALIIQKELTKEGYIQARK